MKLDPVPAKLPDNPLPLLLQWFNAARADGALPNPDSMTLVTVDAAGQPTARIVLCKEIVADPGYLVFYTNYGSAKGHAIAQDNRVAAVFHWDYLNRQIRIEGLATISPAEESDCYFQSRDRASQIGAWASVQSETIKSQHALRDQVAAITGQHADTSLPVPRPPFWGGYRIWFTGIELWSRGDARLHDRGRWDRTLSFENPNEPTASNWQNRRLQP